MANLIKQDKFANVGLMLAHHLRRWSNVFAGTGTHCINISCTTYCIVHVVAYVTTQSLALVLVDPKNLAVASPRSEPRAVFQLDRKKADGIRMDSIESVLTDLGVQPDVLANFHRENVSIYSMIKLKHVLPN